MRRQPRLTKAITVHVTQMDYEQMETRAGRHTVSEWAREKLLKETNPTPDLCQLALMEQIWALRYILINAGLPNLTQDLVNLADAKRVDKALSLFTECRR